MNRNFDLSQLRTFIAVAESSNFGHAAQAVHRTQSAVTQQIQRLEEQLGLPLFAKHGRYKKITEHGENLLPYARRIMAINDEAWRTMRNNDMVGAVKIGAPQDVADSILSPLLSKIARYFPQLQIEIHVNRSPVLMDSLLCGEIDLSISTRTAPQLESVVLRTSPTVWICAADYSYLKNKPIELVLADEPSLFRKLALTTLDQHNIPWKIAYVAPHMIGIKAAIKAGLGITARSVEFLSPELRVLSEEQGLPRLPDVNYYLCMRRDLVSQAIRQVFDAIATQV